MSEGSGRSAAARRTLRWVTVAGILVAGGAVAVWARSCSEAAACEKSGGKWNGEWRVCVR